jgi:hypothetical protein
VRKESGHSDLRKGRGDRIWSIPTEAVNTNKRNPVPFLDPNICHRREIEL